jgi:hypothetical protein
LKKCGLLAFVEGQRQFVQLSRARPAKPLAIDFDKIEKNAGKVILQLDSPPEAHNLLVQITGREGSFPPNILVPGDILELQPEGKTEIIFTEEKLANIRVAITGALIGQKIELETTVVYVIPGQEQQRTFNFKEADNLSSGLVRQQNKIQPTFDRAANGSATKREAGKKLDQLKKQIDFFQDLGNLYQTLNKQGTIQYRVYIPYGKYNVDLFNTQAPAVEPAQSNDAAQKADGKTESNPQPAKKQTPKKTKKPQS